MNKTISSVLIIYILLGLVLEPKLCMQAATGGIDLCLKVVIPSLFPFFVCSKLLIKNGFAEAISKPLGGIMRPIFNVPGCGAYAFIIGILSGCPVGASTVMTMYSKNMCTRAEAQRLLCFCNNSGPIFIMGSVAVGMLGYPQIGIILYLSHILSAVIIGLIMSQYRKKEIIKNTHIVSDNNLSGGFAESMSEAVSLIGYVCGFVVFFAVAIAILRQSGFIEALTYKLENRSAVRSVFYGMLEMTNGISLAASGKITTELLCLISFVLGFGGLSVILQVSGIISPYGFSTMIFSVSKLLQGIISVILTFIITSYTDISLPVFSSGEKIYIFNYWANSINIFAVFGIIILFLSILSIACKILRRV